VVDDRQRLCCVWVHVEPGSHDMLDQWNPSCLFIILQRRYMHAIATLSYDAIHFIVFESNADFLLCCLSGWHPKYYTCTAVRDAVPCRTHSHPDECRAGACEWRSDLGICVAQGDADVLEYISIFLSCSFDQHRRAHLLRVLHQHYCLQCSPQVCLA
jgi:hypothetical protein